MRTFANGTTVKALRLYGFGFGREREFRWRVFEEVKGFYTEGTEKKAEENLRKMEFRVESSELRAEENGTKTL
jgi:hypothetical protein